MARRIASLVVILIVIGLSSSVVMALPPMGPPRALVGQDRWAVDVGVSHSRMDLEAYGEAREDPGTGVWLPPSYAKHKIEDFTSNMLLARVSFGAYDTVDVFACLGLSDARDDMTEELATGMDGNRYSGLECGPGLAYGFGARASFWQEGDIVWGGLIQLLWQNPRDGDIDLTPLGASPDPSRLTGNVEIDLLEIQVAVGPTLQLDRGFSLYGGPFLHIVTGELDVDVSGRESIPPNSVHRVELSQDIREESQFGIFAGAQGDIGENATLFVEFQMTGDAWGVGVGGIGRF